MVSDIVYGNTKTGFPWLDAPIVAGNTWIRLRLLKNMPCFIVKRQGHASTRWSTCWENFIVDRGKIQRKFYPLQHEKWLRACSELTKVELEVLYFIHRVALGQILIYSGFYSQHQKQLHLFGSAKELEILADIRAACLSFDIQLTSKKVQK